MSQDLVDALDEVWSTIAADAAELTATDWDRPTGCPGWTVKDQLSHVVWAARIWGGEPAADVEVPERAHVHTDMARYMERDVEARRTVAPADVVAEFEAWRARAIESLRSHGTDGLDAEFAGPMGMTMPRRRWLPISVFDQWVHLNDMRQATGRTPVLSGRAADQALQVVLGALSRAAEAPYRLVLTGGRADDLVVGDGEPVATVTVDAADFFARACGRDVPRGTVTVEGDRAVGESAFAVFPVTP